jgi:hypothetical protein
LLHTWYASKTKGAMHICMQDELLQNAAQKVVITARSSLIFLAQSLQVQLKMIPFFGEKVMKEDEKRLLHCFSLPCLSLAGYTWQLFRLYGLKESLFSIGLSLEVFHTTVAKVKEE